MDQPGLNTKVSSRALFRHAWVRGLMDVMTLDCLGRGVFLAGSAVFFTKYLGLSPGQVGLGVSLAGLAGAVAAPVIGRVADNRGPMPTLASGAEQVAQMEPSNQKESI